MQVATPPEAPRSDDWRGSGTILLVDDEETVRNVAKAMLEHLGFTVLTAEDGHEAVATFQQHQTSIVAVVLDLTMPQMDGEEALTRIREIGDVPVVLSSGFGEIEASERFAGKKLAGFIQKPYELSTLEGRLREILGH